jgi:hypothetical protein
MLGRRIAVLLISVFALGAVLAPAASAHKPHRGGTTVYIPPGLSAASQYTEVVPTAGGGTPSSNVGSGGASSLPSAVVTTLNKSGSAGKNAARLAAEGAPARSAHKPKAGVAPKSASASVTSAVIGSSGGGILLPALLIGSILLASGVGIVRMLRK